MLKIWYGSHPRYGKLTLSGQISTWKWLKINLLSSPCSQKPPGATACSISMFLARKNIFLNNSFFFEKCDQKIIINWSKNFEKKIKHWSEKIKFAKFFVLKNNLSKYKHFVEKQYKNHRNTFCQQKYFCCLEYIGKQNFLQKCFSKFCNFFLEICHKKYFFKLFRSQFYRCWIKIFLGTNEMDFCVGVFFSIFTTQSNDNSKIRKTTYVKIRFILYSRKFWFNIGIWFMKSCMIRPFNNFFLENAVCTTILVKLLLNSNLRELHLKKISFIFLDHEYHVKLDYHSAKKATWKSNALWVVN